VKPVRPDDRKVNALREFALTLPFAGARSPDLRLDIRPSVSFLPRSQTFGKLQVVKDLTGFRRTLIGSGLCPRVGYD